MPVFIENFDISILRAIDSLNIPFLNAIAQGFSLLCEHGLLPILLALALLIPKRTRRVGAAMAVALLLSVIFTNIIIKPLVARPRPYVKYDIHVSALLPHDLSFPSGHTSVAFAAAMAVAATIWRKHRGIAIAAVAAALLVGLSRIWLKVHYPSDIIVGALLGSVYGLAAAAVARFISRKFPRLNLG